MTRYLAILMVCLLSMGSAFAALDDDLEAVRIKIENLTEAPFTGSADEYPAYVTAMGDEILGLVEPFMENPDLTEGNKKFLTDRKLLGLQLRYGFDNEQYEQKYVEFLEAAQDYALYRSWISRQYSVAYTPYWFVDKAKQTEIFVPLVDRLAPLVNKYFNDEKRDSNEQLPSILVGRAQAIDPDGSLGLVRSTLEKLMPILETDAKRPEYDLLRFCAQRSLNATRLFDMVVKPVEFAPTDIDNKPVDLNKLKGKVVLVVTTPPPAELYETLKEQGLEAIIVSNDNPEIARQQLKSKGETWIVTKRYGGSSRDQIDFTKHFGSFTFAFVIDREGIVTCARTDGFSPEICEALKPLFPEQAEFITEVAGEIRENYEKTRKEYEERRKNDQEAHDGKLPEPLQKLIDFRMKISTTAPSEMRLALADLILVDENLPEAMRFNILQDKVWILGDLARKTVNNNPEMRPETAYQEVDALVDELLKTADPEYHHNLIFVKHQALHHMREYLKTLDSGREEYADEITRRFIANTKQTPESFFVNANMFAMFYRGDLEDIDAEHSTQLAKSFIKQVIPVFAEKESLEYKQEAKHLENVLRRLELIGQEMEFETVLLDGSQINVKDLRGKVVVVNFWATTCGPCLREFPHMKTLYEKYKSQGYEMIAYSCGDDEETLKDFVEKNDYPWLVGSLLKSIDAKLTNYNDFYGITGIPTTMILDRSGKVRFMMVGSDDEVFARELEKRFAEEPNEEKKP